MECGQAMPMRHYGRKIRNKPIYTGLSSDPGISNCSSAVEVDFD